MTLDDFIAHIETNDAPPAELSQPVQALWLARKGDWHKAHEVCQAAGNREGDWVHAYLHREEGDDANAGYWYRRAGRSRHPGTLEEEWAAIASELLG